MKEYSERMPTASPDVYTRTHSRRSSLNRRKRSLADSVHGNTSTTFSELNHGDRIPDILALSSRVSLPEVRSSKVPDGLKKQQQITGNRMSITRDENSRVINRRNIGLSRSTSDLLWKINREKEIEQESAENWILHDQLKEQKRRQDKLTSSLKLSVLDEDPMTTIERRLDEIRKMTRRNVSGEHGVLSWLDAESRERVQVSTFS